MIAFIGFIDHTSLGPILFTKKSFLQSFGAILKTCTHISEILTRSLTYHALKNCLQNKETSENFYIICDFQTYWMWFLLRSRIVTHCQCLSIRWQGRVEKAPSITLKRPGDIIYIIILTNFLFMCACSIWKVWIQIF